MRPIKCSHPPWRPRPDRSPSRSCTARAVRRSDHMSRQRIMACLLTAAAVTGALAVALPMTSASAATCPPAWDAAKAYTGGQQASYNGRAYTAKWWSQGERPDLNNGDGGDQEWRVNGACDGGTPGDPGPSNPNPDP